MLPPGSVDCSQMVDPHFLNKRLPFNNYEFSIHVELDQTQYCLMLNARKDKDVS